MSGHRAQIEEKINTPLKTASRNHSETFSCVKPVETPLYDETVMKRHLKR